MPKTKALIILSGGADSTICLFWAKQKFDEIHAVSYYYGQRHSIELESAKKVAEMAGVASHEFLDIDEAIKDNSAMTQTDQELNKYTTEEVGELAGIQTTFVPGRNIIFLTIGANRAWDLGARNIVTGLCESESGNYSDVTSSFVKSMQETLSIGMGEEFHIYTPLMTLTKAESIKFAQTLPGCMDALAYTTTSYAGDYPPLDNNHATVLRAKGFEEADVADPLIVRAWQEGLMELPITPNYDGWRYT